MCDYPSAKLVKVAANAFLATKLSFINAMADVCEVASADVVKLVDALGHDERIGCTFFNASVGFGGGCLPKDRRAFMARAGELGVDKALEFLREFDAINVRGRARMVDLAREQRGSILVGTRVSVLVLRAAFKQDSDDIRDPPALDIAQAARDEGRSSPFTARELSKRRALHPALGYAEWVGEGLP